MDLNAPQTQALWEKLCCSNQSWYRTAEDMKHHAASLEDADTFLDKWSKAQERAIDAERALRKAWYIMDTIEGNDAVDEWQNKYSKYIESDYHGCPDCDALASYGANDGPCERHKL